jgi:nucleolysin TIA-1/TIAR
VYNQSSPTNCTVYCGGFAANSISDELMQSTFAHFGTIQEIRTFKEKGYAFIKFATKEAATHAIETIRNTEINGHTVKCFWGKENGGTDSQVCIFNGELNCRSKRPRFNFIHFYS